MNPGLLDQRLTLERNVVTADSLGQPLDAWQTVGSFRARRKPGKAKEETVTADRDTEARPMVFVVRSLPFVSLYQPGDRLIEDKRTGFPVTGWKITGWNEVEGTRGMYVEIHAESVRGISAPGGEYVPPDNGGGNGGGGDGSGGDSDLLAGAGITGMELGENGELLLTKGGETFRFTGVTAAEMTEDGELLLTSGGTVFRFTGVLHSG